jgi:hypothetical protein
MKKIYSFIICCLPLFLEAQTITQNDLPTAGIAFTLGTDSTYSAPVPPGGMNQTWNYSALQNLVLDTAGFILPAATPFSSLFPVSNLASHDVAQNTYAYYTSNSSGFYIDGFVNGGTILSYTQPDLYIPVPLSYGTTRNNTARSVIDTTVIDTSGNPVNLRIVFRIESQFIADGTGNLTTPTTTYSNVLRLKITTLTYDSVYVDIGGGIYFPLPGGSSVVHKTHYRYLSSGLPVNYLLGIEADSTGTTSVSSEYLIASINLSVPYLVIENSPKIYPNPVFHEINFNFLNEEASLIIYNTGKQIISSSDIYNKPLNVEKLKNGVYHYLLIKKDQSEKGSIVIQH